MKENLKPYVYKLIKHVKVRYRTFCRTVRRANACSEVKLFSSEAIARASLNRAFKLHVLGPKPSDLPMVRLKWK